MTKKQTDSDYPQEEAEKRRDELLGNLLRTPPQPRDGVPQKKSGRPRDTNKARNSNT